MRSQEVDKAQAVQKLRQDLQNSPLHCFGCHSNCSPDYCKTVQKQQNQQQQQQQQHESCTTEEATLVSNVEEDTTTDDIVNNITSGTKQ